MNQTKQQPSYSEQSVEIQPEPTKKPKTILWIILAAMAAIVLISWVAWTYQKTINEAEKLTLEQSVLKLKKQVQQDETVDWQTYKNEEYGFEFKYPKGWDIVLDDLNNKFTIFKTDKSTSYPELIIKFLDEEYSEVLSKEEKFFKEWQENITGQIEQSDVKMNNIKFSDISGKEFLVFSPVGFIQQRIILPKSNKTIVIESFKDSALDPILSTFRFLDVGSKIDFENGLLKDESSIYDPGNCFPDELENKIDVASFEKISHCYMRDKFQVYFMPYCGMDCTWDVFRDVDVGSFEEIKHPYSKDKNYVYYRGRIITGADIETFEIISLNIATGYYSKDKKFVYYEDVVVEGADP